MALLAYGASQKPLSGCDAQRLILLLHIGVYANYFLWLIFRRLFSHERFCFFLKLRYGHMRPGGGYVDVDQMIVNQPPQRPDRPFYSAFCPAFGFAP